MSEHTRGDDTRDDAGTRTPEGGSPPWASPAAGGDGRAESALPGEEQVAAPEAWRPLRGAGGLSIWLAVLLLLGGGGLVAHQQEMAALVALAGLFATAQAADLDVRWRGLHRLIAWIVPVGGMLLFLAFANAVYESDMTGALRTAAFSMAIGGALVALATMVPPATRRMSRILFRTTTITCTLDLATRLIVLGLWLALVGIVAAEIIIEPLLAEGGEPLLARISPLGQTVGSLALAMAAVGCLVRRGLRETLRRLGLEWVTARQLVVIVVGVAALFGLNVAADQLQQALLPDLWARDQRVNSALAAQLVLSQAIAIGLMAGISEEITLRGALQPRLGLVLTSLLFAILHVQYSWFGMLVIFAFGMLLGMIRNRTNTTVVVAVHAAYDVVALMSLS